MLSAVYQFTYTVSIMAAKLTVSPADLHEACLFSFSVKYEAVCNTLVYSIMIFFCMWKSLCNEVKCLRMLRLKDISVIPLDTV